MSILSENIEPGYRFDELFYIKVWGAGGWCPVTTKEWVREVIAPSKDVEMKTIHHLMKDMIKKEVFEYAERWYKDIQEKDITIKNVKENYFGQSYKIIAIVDGDVWLKITLEKRRNYDIG